MSMVRVALIITISSSYSGIFEGTGLLNGLKSKMGLGEQKNHRFWYDPYDVHGGGDGGLQPDTGNDAGGPGLQGSGAGSAEICDRYGKLGNRYGSAHSVVHRGCGSAGVCVGAACVDRGGGVPVSASNLASYCESQKGCLINFNFSSLVEKAAGQQNK